MKADTDYPLVSVIILNYNGESYLANCLSSVLETRYSNFEVILVDNASTDSSRKWLRKLLELIFAQNHKERCKFRFQRGNNIGFNYAKGDYIVFLNNDTIVDSKTRE